MESVWLDTVWLGRLQFATTTIFHYLFVPLSIGLVFLVAIMETMYVKTGNEQYKKMTKFWGHLFLVNFAVGVVTGILQEFQFGMNWSEYSRFVGDVFGAPLAIEALLAFFMESTFIGIWIFGWDKLPKKIHLACIWLVFLGVTLSAFFILSANSFMQNPVGFEINNGRAEMNDFLAILTNGQLWVGFPHTLFAALLTGAFLVTGVSAYMLLRNKDIQGFYKKSFTIAIIVGLVSSFGVAFAGHSQAQYLVETQPMKMAASEGLWERSSDPAPWTVFAVIDPENKENTFEIKIPYLLSFMSYSKFSGDLKGMNELQAEYEQAYGEGDYIPPVRTTFWSFRIMVAAGMVMIAQSLYGCYLIWRKKLENKTKLNKFFMHSMIWAISLPYIANTTGWIMTEVGRQPWTVTGLFTVADSISPNVSAGQIIFSLIAFTAAYTILGAVTVYLFVKMIKKGPYEDKKVTIESNDPFDKEGYRVS